MEIQDSDGTKTTTTSNDDSVYLGLIIFGSVVFALGELLLNSITSNFLLFPSQVLFFFSFILLSFKEMKFINFFRICITVYVTRYEKSVDNL